MNKTPHDSRRTEEPLSSWKEIGAYLQRDAATARRWEKGEGLPVHRHSHKIRSSVYAYPSEIEAWRASRKVIVEPTPPPLWKTLLAPPRSLAFGATLALCLVMVGNGLRPQQASAQEPKQTARQVWTGTDVDDTGGVSADGRYLSFTDWTKGDLAIRDLATGTNRRLTDAADWEKRGEFADYSRFSPDGSQIAYVWFMDKETRSELRVLPVNADRPKEPRTLARSQGNRGHTTPVGWTPDGRQLLVLRYLPADRTAQLGMITLEDGSYRALKSGWGFSRPRLSPDGRWVAYGGLADQQSQVNDIYLLSTDGTQETNVVQHPANDVPVEWSPDGSRLYFMSTRTGDISLWSIGVASGKATGAAELVRANAGVRGSLGMTRSGTLYYSVRGGGGSNIYSAQLSALGMVTGAPALVNERFVNSTFGAVVSPDGKSLAYYSMRPGPEHFLIVRTLETGKERDFRSQFRLWANSYWGPAWFPDSRSLLITNSDAQNPGIRFVRLNLSTGEQEFLLKVTGEAQSFKLSLDGKTLFYAEAAEAQGPQGSTRLVRYDLDTRRETELSTGKWISSIAVSPDGKQLAYMVEERASGSKYLAVMPAGGGPAKELFRAPELGSNALEWTRDQKFLLFAKDGNVNAPASLWRVPAGGGDAVEAGLARKGWMMELRVHPDEKRLFFTARESAATEIWALENFIPAIQAK